MAPISVLMVCTGNICRSPLADAMLKHIVKQKGLDEHFANIDSCGTTSYHVGDEADPRTISVCRKYGVKCDSIARLLTSSDFDEYDYIFGMDSGHVSYLKNRAPKGSKAQIQLFGDLDDGKDIDDPYYGGRNGFDKAFEQCERYSLKFLQSLGLISKA